MKRIDLIKRLEKEGCVLLRHGKRHDWYYNAATHVSQPIPRHTEVKETLAHHILKMMVKS